MSKLGFIILRHFKNEINSKYWEECYFSIRKFYPDNKIIIIDNNSDKQYLNTSVNLQNCEVIESEYPECRLFTPYYYILTQDFDFETVVILHDGMIFTDYVDFSDVIDIKFLWHFSSKCCLTEHIPRFISEFTNSEHLLELYNSFNWIGSLGATCVTKISFIKKLNEKYNIINLKDKVKCLDSATAIERIIGVLSYEESCTIKNDPSYFGDCADNTRWISEKLAWGYDYNNYILDKKNNSLKTPLIKLFGNRLPSNDDFIRFPLTKLLGNRLL
jgi:hypothetical protein